jgi:DNA-binding NarL/FixJ family response regulator
MATSGKEGECVRVLIADDFPPHRETVSSLLAPFYEVVGEAADGQALLESALRLQPDVIITDITMPAFSGIEAVRKLREAGCKAKIIFLTVHNDHDFVSMCMEIGAVGYVLKARLMSDLLPAIQEGLAGRVFVSPTLDAGAKA